MTGTETVVTETTGTMEEDGVNTTKTEITIEIMTAIMIAIPIVITDVTTDGTTTDGTTTDVTMTVGTTIDGTMTDVIMNVILIEGVLGEDMVVVVGIVLPIIQNIA